MSSGLLSSVRFIRQPSCSHRVARICRWRYQPTVATKISVPYTHSTTPRLMATVPSVQTRIEAVEDWLRRNSSAATMREYETALKLLAESRLSDAPLRSERLVSQLEKRMTPSPECYQYVIESWATAIHEDPGRAVVRAERWLWKQSMPTLGCFNAFLDLCTCGRAFRNGQRLGREHVQKAYDILDYMLGHNQPCNTETFNFVMRGSTRDRTNKDIVDNTLHILSLFENYQKNVDSSVGPNILTYSMVLDSLAVKVKLKVSLFLENDYPSEPEWNGLKEIGIIEQTLSQMGPLVKNTHCYNNLIAAWANASVLHSDAPFQAEKVLQQLIGLSDERKSAIGPDVYSYHLVMRAWATSDKPNRVERIDWWLDQLKKQYHFLDKPESLRPTTSLYSFLIRAFGDLGKPEKSEELVQELESGRWGAVPNSESYSQLIKAWLKKANEGSVPALQQAQFWLNRLADGERENKGLTTAVDQYSLFLSACSSCAAKSPAVLELSVDAFDQLRQSHHTLNCFHYSRMLEIALATRFRSEHEDSRTAFVRQLFSDCCQDGLVSRPLLLVFAENRRKRPAIYNVANELMSDWPLPAAWTRNLFHEVHRPSYKDLVTVPNRKNRGQRLRR